MRKLRGTLIFCVVVAVLGLLSIGPFTGSAWSQSEERYTVKKGETLESIAKKEYNDPSLWVLLWDTNQDILEGVVSNPSQEIPEGTEILIPKLQTVEEKPANETSGEGGTTIVSRELGMPIASPTTILMGGYISPVREQPAYGMVMGSSRSNSIFMGTGEKVHIKSFGPMLNPGEYYVCVNDWAPVYHPITGRFLGYLRKVTGIIKVLCFQYPNGEAVIVDASPTPVTAGDRIFMLKGMPMPIDRPFHMSITKEGYIVELYDLNRTESEDFEYVYIDLGKKDGLLPGAILYVLKETPIVHTVGKLVVLSTQDHTATTMLVRFSDPIVRGMRVTTREYCPPIHYGNETGIPECPRPAPPEPPSFKPHYPGEMVPVGRDYKILKGNGTQKEGDGS